MMSEEGGDDSPPGPKRNIKTVLVFSSSSESDSDESVGVADTRRKRLRVISDGESSDSSGSSIICSAVARRRTLPKLRDSEAESDSSGWISDGAKLAAGSAPSKPASGFASDSSEDNSDKCSVCLLRFTDQQVGTPETCEHIFCLDCITEWSKNVNTCPVDRITFNKIIVKACAGGRVLHTEEVKVVERTPSIEFLVTEDITVCAICGNSENEETMMLCDGCDLGYHFQCLTPPLTQVPVGEWLCSSCTTSLNPDNMINAIELSEVEDLLNDIDYGDSPLGPRSSVWRQPRNIHTSSRTAQELNSDQPSTSSGSQSNNVNINELPTTSTHTGNTQRITATTTRRKTTTKRRKYKRRKTKTVIIEYEVQQNGKFPITKRVKRKVKRRVKKRQPRTAARRSHVRASVRVKLASLRGDVAAGTGISGVMGQGGVVRRPRAVLPSLRLFGNPNELDYFTDEDTPVSEEASTAVAVAARPTSNILSAYRQARRKMVSIPSPPHASSAPDILSNILESQTLLHSKQSIISISVDGNVDYKLTTPITNVQRKKEPAPLEKKDDKVDLSKVQETVRSVPSYGGQGRGGGGWGGGYRGNYHRDQAAYRGGYQVQRAPQHGGVAGGAGARDHGDHYDNYPRRQHHYPADDNYFERRRPAHPYAGHQHVGPGGGGQSWQPPALRNDVPPAQSRHSFGGFENPVDMRMGQMPPHESGPRHDALPPQTYRPMSDPPVFNFQKLDIDKSEDEKSDSGLIIDTEQYDPMEPTNDDSGDDEEAPSASPSAPMSTDAPPSPPPVPPSPPAALHPLLASIDAGAMNVPPNILDTAVRQVLKEHRNMLSSPVVESRNERSDDDSDGDCPNFSIYSATSVHIANNTSTLTDDIPKQLPQDNLEDLVQEDDETPPSTSPVVQDIANIDRSDSCKLPARQHHTSTYEINEKKKTEEEYKEKISKRCPITTNTRNPIKIKLNTPSLIKRQVSLYDEEDKSPDEEDYEKTEPSRNDEKKNCNVTSPKCDSGKTADRYDAKVEPAAIYMSREVVQSEHMSPNKHVSEKNTETHDKVVIEALSIVIANKEKENLEKGSESEDNEENVKEFIDNNSSKDPVEEDLSDLNEDLHDHADIDTPETDMVLDIPSPKNYPDSVRTEDNVEKMTESISETEDERSYTPCLDENRSVKDASFDVDKDKGLEGLGTEMISEEEGNEMFSENERPPSEASRVSPPRAPPSEDGEIADKRKEGKKSFREDSKKKKKKESKKEGKEKSKNKKKGEVSFKKLSKSGKERNYRERDKDEKKNERERRDSGDDSRNRRRKEKRKDLERYDVRTVVTEKRRKQKDPFGRDVSPRGRSPSLSPPLRSPSRRSHSPLRRRSPSPARRRSLSRHRSPSPSRRRSLSRHRSPSVRRRSLSRRRSPSSRRSPSRRRSISRPRRSVTPRASPRRRSPARRKRRPSVSRASRVPRRRSASASPRRRLTKKKKRARRALCSPAAAPAPVPRPPSPRTPPPTPPPDPALDATLVRLIDEEVQRRERRRREPERRLTRRARDVAAPSKEVFTSGDNILVSVSFKEQERGEDAERRRRRETRREKRRRRRAAPPESEAAKPVAIIDLERSPFRELTPSPKHVIVLSDSDHGERAAAPPAPPAAPTEPAPPASGPKTPPSPATAEPAAPPVAPTPAPAAALCLPDAYDPFEPTRSPSPLASPPSASPPICAPAEPPRALLTLEAAQRSNLSADDVLDRRPLTPVEKVLALLASCEEAEGAEEAAESEGLAVPPMAVAPRIVLPSPTRAPPKLFPGKPSPIKSNPVKPMQALRLPRAPAPGSEGGSPYSPGSSDFGELFEPPPRRPRHSAPARDRKRGGKTQVGVKLDDDNFKILEDLPSSAVEMQVKSKFLKKLNRQERVVEEVKLVLKPHYNKKHVTKEEYKDILRRAVPKICHNKSGEINPTKIQALVEAYVKKFRKKHKLGVA